MTEPADLLFLFFCRKPAGLVILLSCNKMQLVASKDMLAHIEFKYLLIIGTKYLCKVDSDTPQCNSSSRKYHLEVG